MTMFRGSRTDATAATTGSTFQNAVWRSCSTGPPIVSSRSPCAIRRAGLTLRSDHESRSATKERVRIGLTYNLKPEGAVDDRYEEFDSLETIEALEDAHRACGHNPVRLGWGIEMLDLLAAEGVDGVFNLAEGVGGRGRESQVPATLEMLGVPCTGSDPVAIGITLDKAPAKLM